MEHQEKLTDSYDVFRKTNKVTKTIDDASAKSCDLQNQVQSQI